jgi:hypothetical protein
MTVDQLFEGSVGRKTVWTKRGDNVSKRDVSSLFSVRPRTKIERVEEPKS